MENTVGKGGSTPPPLNRVPAINRNNPPLNPPVRRRNPPAAQGTGDISETAESKRDGSSSRSKLRNRKTPRG